MSKKLALLSGLLVSLFVCGPALFGSGNVDPDGTWKHATEGFSIQITKTGTSGQFALIALGRVNPPSGAPWTLGTGRIGGTAEQDPGAAAMGLSPPLKIEVTLEKDGHKVENRTGRYFHGSSPTISWDTGTRWELSNRRDSLFLGKMPENAPQVKMPAPGTEAGSVRLVGPTMRSFNVPTGQGQCRQACIEDERCKGYSYQSFDKTCELKDDLGTARSISNWISWLKPPPGEVGPGGFSSKTQLVGQVLREEGVGDDLQVCMRLCDGEPRCEGASYNREARLCQLFTGVTGSKAAAQWTSYSPPGPKLADWGEYTENATLTGETFSKSRGYSLQVCEEDCEADPGCKAISYGGPDQECQLKGAVGATARRSGWRSWIKKPPEFKMSSPLCKGHDVAAHEGRSYRFKVAAGGDRELVIHEKGGLVYEDLPADKNNWFKGAWRLYALPDGSAHIHHRWKEGLVLTRRGEGLVADFPTKSSRWFIEYGFEHADFPDMTVVFRSPEDGAYIIAQDDRLTMGDDPREARANWRVLTGGNALTVGLDPNIPTVLPPRPPLDEEKVNLLVNWCIEEQLRRQIPACWKDTYGRGAGWVSMEICREEEGKDCEVNGLLYYPKCKEGYGNDGCCICAQRSCPSSGQTTNCGALCATSEAQCAVEIVEMTTAVGDILFTIGSTLFTGGSASAAYKAAKTAGKAAAKIGLRAAMKAAGRAFVKSLAKSFKKQMAEFATKKGIKKFFKNQAQDVGQRSAAYAKEEATELVVDTVLEICADKIALQAAAAYDPDLMEIAELIDPTGITGVVNAFNKPACTETPWPF